MSIRSRAPRITVWLGFTAASIASAQPSGPPPAQVVVGEARVERIEQFRPATGEIRAHRRATVAAAEDGEVIEVLVRPGDPVTAGQPIARLDAELLELDAEVARATLSADEAALAEAEALLADARTELERFREVDRQGSAAPRELDRAEAAFAAAEARRDRASADVALRRAELRRVERRLRDMTVVAPFDGAVVERMTEQGQWVSRGDAIAEIVELGVVEAWIDVPERSLRRLAPPSASEGGAEGWEPPTVRVNVPALAETFAASDYALVPAVDPLARQFPVRIVLQNPDGWLRPGMSCTGLIPTSVQRETLTVPKDALLRDDAGEFLYFDRGGVAAVARVSRMFGFGDRVAIRDGSVPPGSRVIVRGNERVFPGQPLIILNSDEPGLDGANAGNGQPSDGEAG